MATVAEVCHSKENQQGPRIFIQCVVKEEQDYLKWVKDLVYKNKLRRFDLKNPAGATLTIGDLEDTTYREEDESYEWGNFYLPEIVKMQVVGVVKGTSLLCDQLVLMTCEDTKVYGFDGEELHLVAEKLDLVAPGLTKPCNNEKGEIKYPGFKTYYRGEAFKDMTEEDWAKVKKSDVGRKLDEEHHKLVTENRSKNLENLRIIREKVGVIE